MDPVTVIVSAVVLGAAAGLKDTATEAVKDAYSALKKLLARYRVDVSGVERKPDSPAQQAALEETVSEAQADTDVEVLTSAQRLAELVKAHDAAAATAVGVDLQRVISEGALRIRDVASSGAGVRVSDGKFGGDIEITGVRSGDLPGAARPS